MKPASILAAIRPGAHDGAEMTDRKPQPLGRLALLLVLVALAMTSVLGAYVMFERLRHLPGIAPPADSGRPDPMEKLKLVLAMVLVAVLAILAFVVGAYLFIRLGRWLMSKPLSDGPTEFVDAWSEYRVTQDEIDAVDGMFDDDGGDNSTPPGDNSGEPDQDDHESPDER